MEDALRMYEGVVDLASISTIRQEIERSREVYGQNLTSRPDSPRSNNSTPSKSCVSAQ